jgi:ligand-binding SRPBCC domain-containing protein
MTSIRVETTVAAPARTLFDLARDVGAHERSMAAYGERVVAGRTSGLLDLGDEVTWRARHLGVRLELTARITELDPPRHFRDSQVAGPFRRMDHDHDFHERGDAATTMVDHFEYELPAGPLGRLADRLVVRSHLRRVLEERAAELKRAAEARPTGSRA